MNNPSNYKSSDIAIIGMSCRFPDAGNIEDFWQNLKHGVESIKDLAPETIKDEIEKYDDLTAVQVKRQFCSPGYVRRGAVLEEVEGFDAAFFGYNPNEAELIDPQQRTFLQIAWEALESAGYDPERYQGLIGVFAGTNLSRYFLINVWSNRQIMHSERELLGGIGSEQDYVATRVSYKLNLKGPGITIQTACSTSLVAVHTASQFLLNGECDMALAGGIRIQVPHKLGYMHHEGDMTSPDGYIRAFDADANGTVFGRGGGGCVLLKRLDDAIRDHDCIHAIIKGSAINNDGSFKAGYTAPSIDGQALVISDALAMADVNPETIGYVEAHGTGTPLGDPIEVSALSRIYREYTYKKQYCAIGSVKTNIGHLAEASGIAALIKTILSLKHKKIVPSLHFKKPNPRIDFANSPFYVNAELKEWKTTGMPCRAAVSAFGVGGTNAHIVLEEAPEVQLSDQADDKPGVVILSAKTDTALKTMAKNLAAHIQKHPELNFKNMTYTLQLGRKELNKRLMLVSNDPVDAAKALSTLDPKRIFTDQTDNKNKSIVFMFSGQGSQYVNMGLELYQNEKVFRDIIDRTSGMLKAYLKVDLRDIIFPRSAQEKQAAGQLQQTGITQTALFVIEYALAKLWMAYGISPDAMIGHSIGEYVAASLAGVFSLEDTLLLVAKRGELMQGLPAGAMLSLPLRELEINKYLNKDLFLATHNAPDSCTVSGTFAAIEKLERTLSESGIKYKRIHTSHAFHSAMMDPILDEFIQIVQGIDLHEPQIPFISNLTGTWIQPSDAVDPIYWARHLRNTVRFSDGIAVLLEEKKRLLLEIGPGNTLSTLARRQAGAKVDSICSSLPHPKEIQSANTYFLNNLGRMWLSGARVNWNAFYTGQVRHKIFLPTYPFENRCYWIKAKKGGYPAVDSLEKHQDIKNWFYMPGWKKSIGQAELKTQPSEKGRWLIFKDDCSIAERLTEELSASGGEYVLVYKGEKYREKAANVFQIRANEQEDYDTLLQTLAARQKMPERILHLWNISFHQAGINLENFERYQNQGFYSLLALARALSAYEKPFDMGVVFNGLAAIQGQENLTPEKAVILGPIKVIPLEYPHIRCVGIDIELSPEGEPGIGIVEKIILEMQGNFSDRLVAYHQNNRWVQNYEAIQVEENIVANVPLKDGGTYLITGGMGGIGFVQAESIAKKVKANLILTGRTALPPREEWADKIKRPDENNASFNKIKKILKLESLGSKVMAATADVTDPESMRAVIQAAKTQFNKIDGIIHSAGMPGGGIIQLKTRGMADKVIYPKVKGALILYELLKQDKLDFVVFNSSLFSVTGGFGQVDYCAANAFFDLFAQYYASQGNRALSINWDAWEEIGMAVKSGKKTVQNKSAHKPVLRNTSHPLIGHCIEESAKEVIYETEISTNTHWIVNEHRINGIAIIPGTAYLEMALASAGDQWKNQTSIELQDVFFFSPATLEEDEPKKIKIILTKEDKGFHFQICSGNKASQNGEPVWQPHVEGRIKMIEAGTELKFDLEVLEKECTQKHIDNPDGNLGILPEKDRALIQFGPRWENLRSLKFGKHSACYILSLKDEYQKEREHFKLHPALMDMATGPANGIFLSWYQKENPHFNPGSELYLPLSYKSLSVFQTLPDIFYSYSVYSEEQSNAGETIVFDILLLSLSGEILASIKGFTLKKISHEMLEKLARPSEKNLPVSGTVADANKYLGRLFSEEQSTIGIYPHEGAEAFTRALALTGLAQVGICTSDLNYRIEKIRGASQFTQSMENEDSQKGERHPRPGLQTMYAAPTNELEKILVEIWQQVLNLEPVGIYDNFFELGADSVLGIQFASRAKEKGIPLAVNQLFETPTVADLVTALSAYGFNTSPAKSKSAGGSVPLTQTWEAEGPPASDLNNTDVDQKELEVILQSLQS